MMKLFKAARHRNARRNDMPRDTDADWAIIGETEPYYGVWTLDRFKTANIGDTARAEFFKAGRDGVAEYLTTMRHLFGPFQPRSVLDFGCGVGRLTVPLSEAAGQATGVDISPGMLAEARRNERPGLVFTDTIPDGLFDWLVSITVFQHIPPARGYELLRDLLARIAPGGGATIQVMFARSERHEQSAGARVVVSGNSARLSASRIREADIPRGTMLVYDYDLSLVVSMFFAAGLGKVHIEHCDHDGMIGAILFARKDA